jgi:hypothetical protein
VVTVAAWGEGSGGGGAKLVVAAQQVSSEAPYIHIHLSGKMDS